MKISIITPCFNSVATMRDAIESVLSQTYNDVEYIIIDGASKDGTVDVVASYGDKVAKFISEMDSGIYDAMNKGVSLATGDVIGILNSDDFYAYADVIKDVVADGVVAIDENVKSSLPYKNNCVVIHNGLNMDGLPQDHRESVVKSDKDICVAFFGNYLKQKGIYEFVQSAHECKKQNLPIKFCIVGPRHTKTGFLGKVLNFLKIKEDMVSLIDKYVTDNGLDNINFVPFQKDIRTFMPNIDILCFPSRMEGIGRPVFEAAFFKKPSIVVITQPMSDTFIDGVTGIAIADGSVQNLCNAYKFFCNNPNSISSMGEAAYELANKNFDINKNTEKLYKFYLDCLNENTASNIR